MERAIIGIPFLVLASAGIPLLSAGAGEAMEESAKQGRRTLLEQSHVDAMWSADAYENAWRVWGLPEKPADYDQQFLLRYGLHRAPYDNGGLPMGLRRAGIGAEAGLTIDCMLCHGGSIAGKSYVGLPNTTVDLPLLFHDLSRASGKRPFLWPFQLSTSRGTTNAGAVAVFLMGFRNPDLSPRTRPINLGYAGMPDLDAPAWWHWKRKKTIYYEGGTDARSTRSIMQFLLGSLTADQFRALEPAWDNVREYLWTLEAPQYPLPIDETRAEAGRKLFRQHCARCHGTYGPGGEYPNRIVAIDEIGTDRVRYDTLSSEFRQFYDMSWFGEKYRTLDSVGYQAPPLDGIWASAPYFHNGSVPTVYGVLNSAARPVRFRRSPSTDLDAYDPVHLGWQVELVREPPGFDLPSAEVRKIFDTTGHGKSNAGHPFGDRLSDEQRMAVIEYLKTL